MIRMFRLLDVFGQKEKKQTTPQTTQKLYRNCVGFFGDQKVNGSVALTRLLVGVSKWQQGFLSLMAGSDTKGVTL